MTKPGGRPRASADARRNKVLFPESGITKGELVEHYERVWRRMAPHLRDRPLAMQRYPDGIDAPGFFQRQMPDYFPDWVERTRVPLRDGGSQTVVLCNSKATLRYLAEQACITPHVWLSRVPALDRPDQLVIDVDPPGRDFAPVRETALRCRALLEELGLYCVAKLTGSRGVHVIVPLDGREAFDPVRDFARAVAAELERRHPDELTTAQRKARRGDRIFLDIARNAFAQMVVAPYAVRALPGAPVAMPVAWEALQSGRVHSRSCGLRDVPQWLRRPDPWSGWRRRARALGPARRRLAALAADAGTR